MARCGASLAILQAIAHTVGKGDTMKKNNDPFITWGEALDLFGMACAIIFLAVLAIIAGG